MWHSKYWQSIILGNLQGLQFIHKYMQSQRQRAWSKKPMSMLHITHKSNLSDFSYFSQIKVQYMLQDFVDWPTLGDRTEDTEGFPNLLDRGISSSWWEHQLARHLFLVRGW